MRYLYLSIVFLLTGCNLHNNGPETTTVITGRVIEAESKVPLDSVEVMLYRSYDNEPAEFTGISCYSDNTGNYILEFEDFQYEIYYGPNNSSCKVFESEMNNIYDIPLMGDYNVDIELVPITWRNFSGEWSIIKIYQIDYGYIEIPKGDIVWDFDPIHKVITVTMKMKYNKEENFEFSAFLLPTGTYNYDFCSLLNYGETAYLTLSGGKNCINGESCLKGWLYEICQENMFLTRIHCGSGHDPNHHFTKM